jgi:hypothetical protein
VGLTNLFTRARIKYKLTDLLNLSTSLVRNRIWDPVPVGSGPTPEPDDVQLIVAFGLDWH